MLVELYQLFDKLLEQAVSRAHEAGQNPQDSLRGFVISPVDVNYYLGQKALSGFWEEKPTKLPEVSIHEKNPLAHIVRIFELSALDLWILLAVMAPDLDRRYERLYAYLQDDVAQKRPTLNLILNIIGGNYQQRWVVQQRLNPESPLMRPGLLQIESNNNHAISGWLSQQLRVSESLLAYIFGYQVTESSLEHALLPSETYYDAYVDFSALITALEYNPSLYIQGDERHGSREIAQSLARNFDQTLLALDANLLISSDFPFHVQAKALYRQGRLLKQAIYLQNWDEFAHAAPYQSHQLWQLAKDYPYLFILQGKESWEPQSSDRRPLLRYQQPERDYETRVRMWHDLADELDIPVANQYLNEVASKFHLSPQQVARSILAAQDLALSEGIEAGEAHLLKGIQANASLQLGQLAQRIEPRVDWQDLVLPQDQLDQLKEVVDRFRYTHCVEEDWGYGSHMNYGKGISVLFAGDSGTGKTLSAQVIARELGLVMYRIDLSGVVSKYIGETEKNLGRIFSEARSSNAILFFDEADALFGKRSEVKDAHDRYANLEIAYLLQLIEDYDGIAILATNLRQNLDEAFTRRLDFLIDFPFPDGESRLRLWKIHFPPQAPLDADINMPEIADMYHLAGGNIKNAALASAYYAAAEGVQIASRHIRHAVKREHQKMGRLSDEF